MSSLQFYLESCGSKYIHIIGDLIIDVKSNNIISPEYLNIITNYQFIQYTDFIRVTDRSKTCINRIFVKNVC